jgi:protein dithiol oxidoreductase (disulfide-forming)
MKHYARLLQLAAFLIFIAAGTAHAQVAGRDYQLIDPPQPTETGNKIEVIEFFWYGCPHCHNLQAPLEAWLKRKPADVEFRRVPAVFQESWLPLTRAFYTMEAMGVTDKLHHAVFSAIHDQKMRLQDTKVLFDWVASKGVDRQKFIDTYNSFAVQGRAKRAMEITRNYDIPGTPAIVVQGRYLTAPSMVLKSDRSIDYPRYFQVVDQVIATARKSPAASGK